MALQSDLSRMSSRNELNYIIKELTRLDDCMNKIAEHYHAVSSPISLVVLNEISAVIDNSSDFFARLKRLHLGAKAGSIHAQRVRRSQMDVDNLRAKIYNTLDAARLAKLLVKGLHMKNESEAQIIDEFAPNKLLFSQIVVKLVMQQKTWKLSRRSSTVEVGAVEAELANAKAALETETMSNITLQATVTQKKASRGGGIAMKTDFEFDTVGMAQCRKYEKVTLCDWIIDSGAPDHYCKDRAMFSNYTEYIPPKEVECPVTRETDRILGVGTVKLVVKLPTGPEHTTLHDVCYNPRLAYNLFSTPRLQECRIACQLHNACEFSRLDTQAVIATGTLYNRRYTLDLCPRFELAVIQNTLDNKIVVKAALQGALTRLEKPPTSALQWALTILEGLGLVLGTSFICFIVLLAIMHITNQ